MLLTHSKYQKGRGKNYKIKSRGREIRDRDQESGGRKNKGEQ